MLSLSGACRAFAVTLVFTSCCCGQIADEAATQETKQESNQPARSKATETQKNPAQIELLETKYRFETNGDSRKEVRARVRINNELGVRQFARLNFDFNRSFQAVDIPLVRITHDSGGIADILPSAITDNPNPAVVDAPAYQDVRVRSVRVLGLAPGDLLEYRVITTTTHHPLAPDFWLDHTFDRTGVVSQEVFEINLPASEFGKRIPDQPDEAVKLCPTKLSDFVEFRLHHFFREAPTSVDCIGQGDASRTVLTWFVERRLESVEGTHPDVSLTTFASVSKFSESVFGVFSPALDKLGSAPRASTDELFRPGDSNEDKLRRLYEFVSKDIRTIDLPLGSTEFVSRDPLEILISGYATPEDKLVLLQGLCNRAHILPVSILLVTDRVSPSSSEIGPSLFAHILGGGTYKKRTVLMDPSIEVAPIGLVPASLLGKSSLGLHPPPSPDVLYLSDGFVTLSSDPPFPGRQHVSVDGSFAPDGTLAAKVRYSIRGENELTLRVAFHQTSKNKWKDVAQMLALSDGFHGQITNVTASDPYATHEPFQVEYEISQPKFVDWTKKPVRVPALLPLPGLPEAEAATKGSPSKKSIDLGTPLDIQLEATVRLPDGTTAQAPTGTSVERDYATFSSKYSAEGNTLHANRKLHFIQREIPAARAADWNTFLHAVQSDQTQLFTLRAPANH